MIFKRAAVGAGVLAALVALAGCGDGGKTGGAAGSSPSATAERLESATGGTILAEGHKVFSKAASVKITGSEVESGDRTAFVLSVAENGDCAGTFDFGDSGRLEVLLGHGQTLFKEDDRLLSKAGGDKAVALGRGRWLRVKPGDAQEKVTSFCDLKSTPVFGDGDWYRQVLSEGTTTVNGRKVVSIMSISQANGSFDGYVATDGPAHPVRVETSRIDGTTDGLTMDFSDYDAPVTVSLPAADQIIDLDSLRQG
ncbi:hypothetical protein PUR71_40085 [Streptomyces sp. SP17BM10]|uniref:hypothetical protein n=1 Tax=Streptomyces sp. SP17BM10 TaxID=3002530 RepID=UPI002E76FB4C|nr:hypothetical protein [Streptomyces sp. SP17BM10]MEE1789059.1 hypothetical protein [Streptomyces sp. SP17BM10]